MLVDLLWLLTCVEVVVALPAVVGGIPVQPGQRACKDADLQSSRSTDVSITTCYKQHSCMLFCSLKSGQFLISQGHAVGLRAVLQLTCPWLWKGWL